MESGRISNYFVVFNFGLSVFSQGLKFHRLRRLLRIYELWPWLKVGITAEGITLCFSSTEGPLTFEGLFSFKSLKVH